MQVIKTGSRQIIIPSVNMHDWPRGEGPGDEAMTAQ